MGFGGNPELAWVLHDVLARPDVLAELRAELARVVGDASFAPEHVGGLTYLDAVIKVEGGEAILLPTREAGRAPCAERARRGVA